MKKGFTILELLVASLLLGMLMTVLTMIFNQSSISWRVGQASIADLDQVAEGISSVHDAADNLYLWNGKAYLLTSVWEEKTRTDGQWLRTTRPLATDGGGTSVSAITDEGRNKGSYSFVPKFNAVAQSVREKATGNPGQWSTESVGRGDGNSANLYTVNVKSAGPNGVWNDYDDIWSFPDDFSL